MDRVKLPGSHLLALARLVVDPTSVTRVLVPLVADWQREWLTAPPGLARVGVRARGLAAFVASGTYCLVTSPAPRTMRRQAWSTLAVFAVLGILPQTFGLRYLPSTLTVWLVPALLVASRRQ